MSDSAISRESLLGRLWDYQHPDTGEWVWNVEGLCRRVMNDHAACRMMQHRDYDETLMHLCGEVVIIADKYNPRDAGSSLGAYLQWKLKYSLVDYLERTYGGHTKFVDGTERPMGWKRVIDTRPLEAAARSAGLDGDVQIDVADPMEEPAEELVSERHHATVEGPEERVDAVNEILEERADRPRPGSRAQDELEVMLEFIDWSLIDDDFRPVVRVIVPMIWAGYKNREIAAWFGRSEDWLATRVSALRAAIRRHQQADLRELLLDHARPSDRARLDALFADLEVAA